MRICLWLLSYIIMIIFHILVMRKRADLDLIRSSMSFGYLNGILMVTYHYHNKILEVARVVPLSIVIVDTFVLIIKVFNEEDEYERKK